MKKKLTIAIAALLSSYAANSFAALPTGNNSRCDICVPSFCGGFTIGITGLYWRPTPEDDFALTFPDFRRLDRLEPDQGAGLSTDDLALRDVDFDFDRGHFHHVKRNYNWGWRANIGYVFPCSGNDVNLTYTHWNKDRRRHSSEFAFGIPTTSALFFPDGKFFAPFKLTAPLSIVGTAAMTTGAGTFVTPGDIYPIGTTFDIEFSPLDAVAFRAKSRLENNTWDLDFGQAINVGCNFRLRWFGGLRYSKLKHDLDVSSDFLRKGILPLSEEASTTAAPVTFTLGGATTGVALADIEVDPVLDFTATLRDIARHRSDFNGVGPRFGIDASYHVGGGFGIVGSLSTSLLAGRIESSFSERIEVAGVFTFDTANSTVTGTEFTTAPVVTGITPAPSPTELTFIDPVRPVELLSFRHPNETRIVPNIDAKIGVDWSYQACNCSRTKVTVEAGYLVSHYFNAIDRLSGVDVIEPAVRARHTFDVSFDGPYVGVEVKI
jgi:Legionella pneumophila major outer membrane protein precursor